MSDELATIPDADLPVVACDAAVIFTLLNSVVASVNAGEQAMVDLRSACGGEPEGMLAVMHRELGYSIGVQRQIRDTIRRMWREKARIERERNP